MAERTAFIAEVNRSENPRQQGRVLSGEDARNYMIQQGGGA